MKATLKVFRYSPETDGRPYYKTYIVEAERETTVLGCLNRIKNDQDGTLSYRYSCESAICGSCAMKINGDTKLACKTRVVELLKHRDEIVVEPMGNMGITKDMISDMTPFWKKMNQIVPWIGPLAQEPPEKEFNIPPEGFTKLKDVAQCIQCGACVSDCNSLEVEEKFIAPAALAKAYRFVGDMREGNNVERLKVLGGQGGVWDCTRCYYCVEVCPKDVKPLNAIYKLREEVIAQGYTDTVGAKHARHFTKIIGRRGLLDEARLPVDIMKFNPIQMIKMAPIGIRMLWKGKLPLIGERAEDLWDIQRIHKEFE